jgi:hypothetical protein
MLLKAPVGTEPPRIMESPPWDAELPAVDPMSVK